MRYLILVLTSLFLLGQQANATVVASWYGPGFHGKKTASGERFNQNALTAAHKTLPFGTRVKVTHKGKSVIVRINDRGPFIKGRTIDLSKGAARAIGCSGTCRVTMTVVSGSSKKKSYVHTKTPVKKYPHRTRNWLGPK